jgi:outer membrane usher protein
MSRFRYLFGARAYFAFIITLGVGLSTGAERLRAAADQNNLQLEVIINDTPTNSIANFVQFKDGRIAATAAELAELGIKTNGSKPADDLFFLDEVPTATYKYDERTQRIFITINNSQRIPREYKLSNSQDEPLPTQTGLGAVLNYNFLGSIGDVRNLNPSVFSGTSLTLDGRMFSQYGTLSQSAYLISDQNWQPHAFRLDSTYRYSDRDSLISYNVGDAITGGLSWTRPIRIGGIQAQRNFALRPDLITIPLPKFSGTAAVPSTVDVYFNNVKTFSQDVGVGPFSIANAPVVTGAGDARIVVRDATGHQTATSLPFYSSPSLLAPGLTSFSLDAGFPRMSYGSLSDNYVATPVGAATLRGGINDWLTLEGHAEGGSGLINAGGGAVTKIGHFGVLSTAVSASRLEDSVGAQGYLGFETQLSGININASTSRTFGGYDDLVSATARFQVNSAGGAQNIFGPFSYISPINALGPNSTLLWTSARPARAQDRITIGTALPFDTKASISASFLHIVDAAGTTSKIVTTSWTRAISDNASIFTTAFTDFGDRRNTGIYVGLSVRLFDSVSASTGVSSGHAGTTATVDAVKPLGPSAGSYGWRVRDSEGAAASREASLAYRSQYAQIQGGVSQYQHDVRGNIEMDGAIATMGDGVFFANRIDDSFAVVRAGVPDIPVMYENRPIGVTDAKGLILIPSLRSYDKNKITIDPSNLPVDADIESTRTIVAPADRSGVLVDFGVRTDTNSALVVFTHSDGSFVPVGSSGKRDSGDEFIVGYDGQAFLKKLAAQNAVVIETPQGQCRAQFAYAPRANQQVVISPVLCGASGSADGRMDLRRSMN